MGKVYVPIEIEVPVSTCYSYVKNSLKDPKFIVAYKSLHAGREYSGRIVEDTENRRLAIEESAIDTLTHIRHKGWTITYEFEETGGTTTRIGVSVEYGTFLALMGMTTTKIQSINEVLARITSLLALEYNRQTSNLRSTNIADS